MSQPAEPWPPHPGTQALVPPGIRWPIKLTVWLALVLAASAALYLYRTPRALDDKASAEQFSAGRAMLHLRQVAATPHFIGTEENHRVRDFLLRQLAGLGAVVKVENAVAVQGRGRFVNAASAQNIVARFRGSGGGRGVMLAAHYDSVERAPGAGDDGSGVITILETMRALQAGSPLKNDVLVVLTDGEETGLLGASGFVAGHPDLADQVGAVLNFEGRGDSGPVVMFETSDENGWWIKEFSRVAPYPMASSLTYTVYKMLPNDTDMTVFKRAGLHGLNFAFVGSFQNYHTWLDTPQNLDRGSVQHMGSYALALTRHFGNLELHDVRQADRVYFNWLGSHLVEYGRGVVWALLLVIAGLLAAIFIMGSRRGMIAAARTALGLGGFVLLFLAVMAGVSGAWWVLSKVMGGNVQIGDTASNEIILLGLVLLGIALGVLAQGWLVAKLGWANLAAGELLGFCLLTVFVSVRLPGASYAFQWPLVFALIGMLLVLSEKSQRLALFWGLLAAIPAMLLFAPLAYQLLTLLSLNSASTAAIAFVVVLFLAVTTPLFTRLACPSRWTVKLLLIGSLCFLVVGERLSPPSPEHPHPDTIFYAEDAGHQKAAWISYDREPDEWTSQFLGKGFRKGREPGFTVGSDAVVLANDAPLLGLEAPTAQVTRDEIDGGGRVLRLHLQSPRHANGLMVRLPSEVKIKSLKWNGREYRIENDRDTKSMWYLRYFAVPAEGVDLELRLASRGRLQCWVGDRSLDLPEIPGQTFRPRAEDAMAWYGSDVTIVDRQYTF